MLERLSLRDFKPSDRTPLVISLVEWVKSRGFTVEIGWEHWDFLVYDHDEKPILVIKTLKNRIPNTTLSRLLVEKAPFKVLLVDGDRPNLDNLTSRQVFLATSGTGVFVRGVGWVSLPSSNVQVDVEELRLKLAKRWSRGKDGIWRKQCTSCGQWKGVEDFYPSAYSTARDPYRNQCKECFSFNSKLAYVARKGRKK